MQRFSLPRFLAFVGTAAMVLAPMAPVEAKTLTRQQVVTIANRQLGIPYVWGGASRRGFDCSGLVQYVYGKVGIRLPRTADRQALIGSPVKMAHARPGDLMFFNTSKVRGAVTHVGIYMGNNRMLHAPAAGKTVRYAEVGARSWFRPRLLGIRRLNRETFELARKPVGWETQALPKGVMYTVSGSKSPTAERWAMSGMATVAKFGASPTKERAAAL